MPIKYKPVLKTSALNGNHKKGYHAKTIANGSLEFEALLKKVSAAAKLSPIDGLRFMLHLEEVIIQELADGKIVRLNNIGSFQIGASSKSVDTIKEVTQETITKSRINYRAGKKFKEMLQLLEFEKVK